MTKSKLPCHVLVVDDLEDNRELMRAVFQSEGMTVTCVESVAEARRELQSGHSIDLVLSDISMPDETGFDLLEWMRSQQEDIRIIPVLFITAALPEDHYRVHGLMLGAVDYMVRPISNQELILRVRNAVEHFQRFQELRRSLESTEDMAMTGRILAAANHEIRNLTGLILMTSERTMAMAQRGQPISPGSNGFECVKTLHKTACLLAEVSRNLNAHITNERVHVEVLNVIPLIHDVLELVRPRLADVMIDVTTLHDDGYVLADPTRLKQVLINFIFNAHESIFERGAGGGRIDVQVVDQQNGEVSILIRDNGIGLPRQEIRTDFEPFRTSKSVRGGKGLGLWLCSRFAQAMGGSIALESKGPGSGATSTIRLQRAQKPSEFAINIEDYLGD